MSDIEKIRQEIEFLRELNKGLYTEGDNSYYEGQDNGYNHILAFIDSLPEETSCVYDTNKFTPTPSVNIEDVARVQFASHAHVFERKRKAVFDWEQFKEVVGIFYGFGKETCKESLQVQETCKENTDSFTDEPKELEEAANEWILSHNDGDVLYVKNAFKDGAKWMANQMLEREDRNDDNLPRYYGD